MEGSHQKVIAVPEKIDANIQTENPEEGEHEEEKQRHENTRKVLGKSLDLSELLVNEVRRLDDIVRSYQKNEKDKIKDTKTTNNSDDSYDNSLEYS